MATEPTPLGRVRKRLNVGCLLSTALMVAGVAMWSVPMALVFAGLLSGTLVLATYWAAEEELKKQKQADSSKEAGR